MVLGMRSRSAAAASAASATDPRASTRSWTRRGRKQVSTAHHDALQMLNENRGVLDMVRALFEKETFDRGGVAVVFEPLRVWLRRPAWSGAGDRVPSSVPPITRPSTITEQTEYCDGQNMSARRASRQVGAVAPDSHGHFTPVPHPGSGPLRG